MVGPAAPAATENREEPTSGEDRAAEAGQRRRQRREEVQEVIDELAQEARRTTLLDLVEKQVKGQQSVSRVLFAFSTVDDKKAANLIEQEFNAWRGRGQKEAGALSGVLVFVGQGALHLLEGPTERLFEAVAFFHSISAESQVASAAAPAGPSEAQRSHSGGKPPLLISVRVLYMSELHGVRACRSWCSFSHGGKPTSNQIVLDEGNCAELLFGIYKKLLRLGLRVQELLGEEQAEGPRLVASYRRASELWPTADEVLLLLSKPAGEQFFSYSEFEKVFVAPFHLVLESELLWPMPPALTY